MNYTGGFFNLLNPYALLGGLSTVIVFLLHGAIFLSLNATGEVARRANAAGRRLWLPVVIVLLVFLVATYFATDLLARLGVNPGLIPLVGIVALVLVGYFLRKKRSVSAG